MHAYETTPVANQFTTGQTIHSSPSYNSSPHPPAGSSPSSPPSTSPLRPLQSPGTCTTSPPPPSPCPGRCPRRPTSPQAAKGRFGRGTSSCPSRTSHCWDRPWQPAPFPLPNLPAPSRRWCRRSLVEHTTVLVSERRESSRPSLSTRSDRQLRTRGRAIRSRGAGAGLSFRTFRHL